MSQPIFSHPPEIFDPVWKATQDRYRAWRKAVQESPENPPPLPDDVRAWLTAPAAESSSAG
jgi:hypothetical protein